MIGRSLPVALRNAAAKKEKYFVHVVGVAGLLVHLMGRKISGRHREQQVNLDVKQPEQTGRMNDLKEQPHHRKTPGLYFPNAESRTCASLRRR